ncbi:MAG TPA: hypothetical protein VEI02_10375 [Planctomycetota bacterium]|nr:hypothetical protein [Planctomycetota bacterium]
MRRSKTAAAGAALVLLAGAGAWRLAADGTEPNDDGARASAIHPTSHPASALEAPNRAVGSAAPVAAAAFQDSEATPQPVAYAGVRVRIRDVHDRPVPGAHVVVFEGPGFLSSPTEFVVGAASPRETVADALGAVFVAAETDGATLVASSGAASGRLRLDRRALQRGGEQDLVLLADRTVDVRVTDAAGRAVPAASVAVTARAHDVEHVGPHAFTDADGVAALTLTAHQEATFFAAAPAIVVEAPFQAPVRSEVTWDGRRGAANVRLPRADLVELEVRTTTRSGEPAPADVEVRWAPAVASSGDEFRRSRRRRAADGRTSFGGFPRGAALRATVVAEGFLPGAATLVIPGEGARATLDAPLGPRMAVLRLPLTDERGDPWTEGAVILIDVAHAGRASASPSNGIEPRATSRDARGVLHAFVAPGVAGTLKLYRDADDAAAPRGRGPAATRAFPAPAPGAVVDLEPATLARPSALVAGRVVDQGGAPAAGALVAVGVSQGGGSEALRRALERAVVRTDADGRFEIRCDAGQARPGTLRVRAATPFAASDVASFEPGRGDVVLTLTPYGGVRGRVRRAPGIDGRITVAVRPATRRREFEVRTASSEVSADGTFVLRGVEAGPAVLTLSYDGVVARTFEVVVPPGELLEDPRFADLLLGEDFFEAAVTVVGPDGAPVVDAEVRFEAHNAPPRDDDARRTDASGVARRRYATAPDRVDVRVFAACGAGVEIRRAAFPLHVKLKEGASVRLTFPDGLPASDDGWMVLAASAEAVRGSSYAAPDVGPRRAVSAFVGADASEVVVPRLARGKWSFTLAATPLLTASRSGPWVVVAEVDVAQDSGEIVIPVRLTEAMLGELRLGPRAR